jgi:ankyrin repeat protein
MQSSMATFVKGCQCLLRRKQTLRFSSSAAVMCPQETLVAVHENHIAIAETLIRSGADVNARDDIDDSPYYFAGAEGRLEILRMTVAAGADLNSVNRYGGTALIPAAHHGHVETVKYLLSTDIDIDHINYPGWTA